MLCLQDDEERKMWKRCLLIFIVFLLAGCDGSKGPRMIIPDYTKKAARLIALMPVDNKTNDQLAPKMLREKILEELYFKGYPKMPLDVIDGRLNKTYAGGINAQAGNISPKAIGALLEVDAVMYCTLIESKTAIRLFYAPTSVSASCELRSAETGETLWRARSSIVERMAGYSNHNLEMKASQVYESAIQEVVNKVMETLPDGAELSG